MIKKVCFLANYNQYETKRHFTEKLSKALNRKGIETKIFDVDEDRIHENVISALQDEKPDFTASFNTVLPFPDNSYLWDVLQTPHLSILLDPSIYSVNLIQSPYSIVSCVDRFDCYGLMTQNFDRVFFMPHAVEKELFERPAEENKEYDVVFIGSCYDYESIRDAWKREFPSSISNVLENAANILFSDNKTPLQETLVRAWQESKLSAEGVDFLKLFTYLDKYTRGLDRAQLISSIKDCEIHIFGEQFQDDPNAIKGWKQQLAGRDNIVYHEPIPYEDSLEVMRKSKICLNSNPFFKDGSHERLFGAAAGRSLLVTTDNLFVREEFKDGEDLLLYQHKQLDGINQKVNHYLSHEEERRKLTDSAFEKAKKSHTWDNRVDLLLEVMPVMIDRCLKKVLETTS